MPGNPDKQSKIIDKSSENQPLLNPDEIVFDNFVNDSPKPEYSPTQNQSDKASIGISELPLAQDKADETPTKSSKSIISKLKQLFKPANKDVNAAINQSQQLENYSSKTEIDKTSEQLKSSNAKEKTDDFVDVDLTDPVKTKKDSLLSKITDSVKKIIGNVIDNVKSVLNIQKSKTSNKEESEPLLNNKIDKAKFSNTAELGEMSAPSTPAAKVQRNAGKAKN